MIKQTTSSLCLFTFLNLGLPVWANNSDSASQWLQIQEPALSTEFHLREKPSSDKESIQHYPDSTWVASFLPGLGQILLNEPLRGFAFMGGFVAAFPAGFGIGYGLAQLQPASFDPRPFGSIFPRGFAEGVLAMTLLAAGVYIWNLTDAYGLNIEKNQPFYDSLTLDSSGNPRWQISKL